MQIKSQAAANEVIANLHGLKQHAGWATLVDTLKQLRAEALNQILSTPILAPPQFNEAEIIRREYNYLDTLIKMPDELADRLKKGAGEIENSDDPNEIPVVAEKQDQDDPQSFPSAGDAPAAPGF